ncbi:MAG: metallophosphatase family protein [Thermodesulfovibrionales bacterium]|nr:metallophosphatase family protein [Thermodesulfovibrionales bacterium]
MVYAIISDVHSNLEALQAVLEDLKKRAIKELYFLGDAVGYGPDPDECLKILESECLVQIAGNHDKAVLGEISTKNFNLYARKAIEWTQEKINSQSLSLLKKYNLYQSISSKDIFLVHATPKNPDHWTYLQTLAEADENFNCFNQKICFIGHTHRPFIVEKKPSTELVVYNKNIIELSEGSRYIVNVGSIGQPRDGDPRACYCIYNDGIIEFHRIAYEIKITQKKMLDYSLPDYLIERLSYGL